MENLRASEMLPIVHAVLNLRIARTSVPIHALAAADTLTMAAAASLFTQLSTQEERDSQLQTRLEKLPLLRTHIAPSTIDGAGSGLFASRDIAVGELVTLYPGDALAMWSSYHGTRPESTADVVFSVDDTSSEWADGFRMQRPEFIEHAWEYGVRISPIRAILGDPTNIGDPAYLGHMANDAAMCLRPGTAAQAYTIASEAAANVGLDSRRLSGCHHAVVAIKDIAIGAEIFLSYGASYWLSRLPVKVKTYTFPDSSTYFGEVADSQIHGAGEYKDAAGNRYIGEFSNGQFEGVGTYFYANGVAEAGNFLAGVSVGVSVGWSADRSEAYRLLALEGGAMQRHAVSLEAAGELAGGLGVPVPYPWPK